MKTSTSEIFANSLFTNQTDGVDSSSNVQTAGANAVINFYVIVPIHLKTIWHMTGETSFM